MASTKKKAASALAAVGVAAALALGGTFAWQSISQTALNEASDVVNPGGRLHDDFYIDDNGDYNADIYVENFADDDIFARVRLGEYMEVVVNQGVEGAETVETIAGGKYDADGDPATDAATDNDSGYDYEYATHYFDSYNETDEFWTWSAGGPDSDAVYYMPTFNKNKDSLVADRNGMYVDRIGGISNRGQEQYEGWTVWAQGDSKEDYAIYDDDPDSIDEVGFDFENLQTYVDAGNVATATETHDAAPVNSSNGLVSMDLWLSMLNDDEDTADFWVYDEDGWVYWSSPIAAGETTGLLLDSVELCGVMDDTWYYAIEATGQFVTADDAGKADGTGFYADGEAPSANAEILLQAIGVDVSDAQGGEDYDPEGGDQASDPLVTFNFDSEIPMAIPAGETFLLGVEDYEADEALSFYLVSAASNAGLEKSELTDVGGTRLGDFYMTTLDPVSDGREVISVEGSVAGTTFTQHFYGTAIENGSWIAGFSDPTTVDSVECVMIVAMDGDEVVASAITKVYDPETHRYVGSNSNGVNDHGWLLVFEALDGLNNVVGHCVANAARNVLEVHQMTVASVTSGATADDYVIGATYGECDGDHSTSAEGLALHGESGELESANVGGAYSGLSVKNSDEEEQGVSRWSVQGNMSTGTAIDQDGNLTVGHFESASEIIVLATLEGEAFAVPFTVTVEGETTLADASGTYVLARQNGSALEDGVVAVDGEWWPGSMHQDNFLLPKSLFKEDDIGTLWYYPESETELSRQLVTLSSVELVGDDLNALTLTGSKSYDDYTVYYGITSDAYLTFRTADYEVLDLHSLYIITANGEYVKRDFFIVESSGE